MRTYKCSCGQEFESQGALAVHLRWNETHESDSQLARFMRQVPDDAEYIAYLLEIEYNGEKWWYAGQTKRPNERFSRHFDDHEYKLFPNDRTSNYEVTDLVAAVGCENKHEAEDTERLLMLAAARWFQTFKVLGGQ